MQCVLVATSRGISPVLPVPIRDNGAELLISSCLVNTDLSERADIGKFFKNKNPVFNGCYCEIFVAQNICPTSPKLARYVPKGY